MPGFKSYSPGRETSLALVRALVWLLPAALLAIAAIRADPPAAVWLRMGAAIQIVVALGMMITLRTWAPPVGTIVLVCYLASVAVVLFSAPRTPQDWYMHLTQGLLVLVAMGMVAAYTLLQSGSFLYRNVWQTARAISRRSDWPTDWSACRELPEIKAFREAINLDAAPALELLRDPRPGVRVASLAALEARQSWRLGQVEVIVSVLQQETVPEVRAAALAALATLEDRSLVEMVANCLRDPDPRVRRAAGHAVLWETERRWAWVRFGVRRALSEPALVDDGPLLPGGQTLSRQAVDDLTAWASEKGVLGMRSVQTLAAHYARAIQEHPEETVNTLRKTVTNPNATPLLRIESARLLCQSQAMEPQMLDRLLDTGNPAPLRLLAAESLLESGPHLAAIASLRDIAHLPNRELALTTADIVQRRLGVDMGLALGQPLPPVNSVKAIDITRRLMEWATKSVAASDNVLDGTTVVTRRVSPSGVRL